MKADFLVLALFPEFFFQIGAVSLNILHTDLLENKAKNHKADCA
jgi:hypothetical protein